MLYVNNLTFTLLLTLTNLPGASKRIKISIGYQHHAVIKRNLHVAKQVLTAKECDEKESDSYVNHVERNKNQCNVTFRYLQASNVVVPYRG